MFQVKTFNAISPAGLALFSENDYQVSADIKNPDAILCRSQNLHTENIEPTIKVIARAGAGTNNIPVEKCTQLGIPVFNTPGANANAVKELVIAGMLLACRHIFSALNYTQNLTINDDIENNVEKNKKQFAGFELPNKTLAVIGLGNIGVKVANAAAHLEMKVIGFDPAITVQNAWELNSTVKQAQSLSEALQQADFISIHIPLNDKTKNLINHTTFKIIKQNAVLLNFSRDEIVDHHALIESLQLNKLLNYVCDFPHHDFLNNPKIICLPHLGASTAEAEENCAIMACQQLIDYLENGHITHSVNFPSIKMPRTEGYRLVVINRNIPNMLAQISSVLSSENINIIDMINKSRDQIAVTLLDTNQKISKEIISKLENISGIVSARAV